MEPAAALDVLVAWQYAEACQAARLRRVIAMLTRTTEVPASGVHKEPVQYEAAAENEATEY